VRPGERIPLDGRIVAGATAIDESPVTGESVPADKSEGDSVFAGTLNTTGLIEFEVTATAEDSTLSRIVFLVEEAQASRATSQQLVDKFSRVYTPAVIGLAVAVAIVPPAIQALLGVDGVAWVDWIQRALVLLVVSCPCALVISTPVSIVSAITRASRDGVLVKGGTHLETGARVRSIAFDKTGTLTQGLPEVVMVEPLGIGRDELLAIAASLEQGSAHPIARAVTRAGEARLGTKNVTEEPGRGVRGWIDGVEVAVESAQAAAADGLVSPAAQGLVDRFEREGATALVVSRAGVAIGVLGVADKVRDESSRVVATLLRQGLEHAVMLTGDNERVAQAVATATGVDEHVANLLPADKTAAIERLRATHGVVAMVGDGVNDAPALALADLGIAMGAAGSDTALETADVALMRDDLDALPGFFALCRRTVRTIKTNVAFSIAVKAVFVVLAVAGHATLWMAVFADTGVALLVIINGMRLLRPVTT
jgi:Cd2+/Zn2+-exporting ATPase